MTVSNDDLRVRPGRIRDRGAGARPKRFVGQVLKAANKAGYVAPRRAGRAARFGRGTAFTESRLMDSSRRVLVKARVVRHRGRTFRSAALATHVAYLKREGVTRDGEKARMFDAENDHADEKAFAKRCEEDRHHFRFVVSPEDAADMTDLKGFARDLVANMERDLSTKLDWVGVDHWNTDNPHIHLLVRGKTDDGRDLVINRDYISRGIRSCAQELVTIELGPKSEREVRSALEREVEADRWTRLDAAIQRASDETGLIDLRLEAGGESRPEMRKFIVGRLQRLERMGLASTPGPSQWIVATHVERTLRHLGVRGDIIKTMHRAMAGQGIPRGVADYAIHDEHDAAAIVGRLVSKGLHDELTGEAYVVIDGVDGRSHYVRFPDINAVEYTPAAGGIVEVRHVVGDASGQPRAFLALRSDLTIQEQVRATGATWLDHQLVVREPVSLSQGGFGQEIRQALEARINHLAEKGLARRTAQRVVFARDLIETLRRRELDATASKLESENALPYKRCSEGETVAGIYRQRIDLASGRFAMIGDGLAFALVPWRPALERRLGRQVSGFVMPGGGVKWEFGRQRGIGGP